MSSPFVDSNPRVRALKLMLDEFEYPSRDIRIAAQALNCKGELQGILDWLRAEIESEIVIETMFDEDG
jgi:hypothetical protein